VGDTFVVHMDREALNDYRWTSTTEGHHHHVPRRNREIAWNVSGVFRGTIGHIYGYSLEPVDNGTIVHFRTTTGRARTKKMERRRHLPGGYPKSTLRARWEFSQDRPAKGIVSN